MKRLFLTSMAIAATVCAAQVQARTVSGIVVDAGTGEELIGATVMPVGGGQGVATDIDGKFTLNVPDNVKTAKVTYVGYKEKTVTLAPHMRVALTSTTSNLDEVVVVAYGTATKESLTGSVSVVGSKEIEERPITNVVNALEGNAPGVQVNSTTGAPGSSPSIRIRGFGTFTGNAAPQYVVDGVIFNGDLADINPNDVESMTVLKDAASCALYGVRGSNGVILITTKRAKEKGRTQVSLSVREGMYTKGLPNYDRLNTDQWMETMFQTTANGLMEVNPTKYPDRATANAYLAPVFISGYLSGQNIYNKPSDELFDENGKLTGYVLPGYTDLDWWDAVSRTGLRQEYNLNLASATDKVNLFASISYLNEKGYTLKTDFERFNGRFRVDFEPTTYLRAGVNMNASYQTSEAQSSAGSSSMVNPFSTQMYAPIFPYYAHDAEGNIIYDADGNPEWNMRGRNNDNRNVAFEMRHNFTEYDASVIDATAYATAIIPYGFELTFRGNMTRTFSDGKNYQNNLLGDAYPDGRLSCSNYKERTHSFIQNLNWGHDYGNEYNHHHVDVLLGHENTFVYGESLGTSMYGQIEDGYYANDNFQDVVSLPSGDYSEGRTESYYARARYNYNQKYFGELSIRRDGADRFAKDNRWGTFWSAGLSWVISKENFMHQLTWVDNLKLHASYGSVGNYLSAPGLSWSSQYTTITYSNNANLIRASIGNPFLKWESQRTFDIGLDGSLFGNRLNFIITYYDKRSHDLIFKLPSAPSLGYMPAVGSALPTPYNLGELANRGWELSFNGLVMRKGDFQWIASLDATFNQNRITKLPYNNEDRSNRMQRFSVGKSIYEWYTYTFEGVDQMTGKSLYAFNENEYAYEHKYDWTDEEIKENWADEVAAAQEAGELVTINGKTYTTSSTYATRTWHGSSCPTVYGSIGSNFTYKNVNFGFLFNYQLGGKVMDSNYQSLMSIANYTNNAHVDVLKSWTGVPEGMTEDSPNRLDPNGIPVISMTDSQKNNMTSSRFLTSASYLVLKNVNISYNFPKAWANKLQMQNINVGFTVDNLFTVTARKGMNPQMTFSGVDNNEGLSFVTNRVFSFQLNCRF